MRLISFSLALVLIGCSSDPAEVTKRSLWSESQSSSFLSQCMSTMATTSVSSSKHAPICTCWVEDVKNNFTPEESGQDVNDQTIEDYLRGCVANNDVAPFFIARTFFRGPQSEQELPSAIRKTLEKVKKAGAKKAPETKEHEAPKTAPASETSSPGRATAQGLEVKSALPDIAGTWGGVCNNWDKGKSSRTTVRITFDEATGVGEKTTDYESFDGENCPTDKKNKFSMVTVRKIKLLKTGMKTVELYENFVEVPKKPGEVFSSHTGKDLIGKIETFKFENQVTSVNGIPSFDGREGHEIIRAVTLDGKTHLLSAGRIIHPNNGKEDEQWRGKDVIAEYSDENAAHDTFNRIKKEDLLPLISK